MSQYDDVLHLAQLVRLSADAIRLICSTKVAELRDCPFRQKVIQLRSIAGEIEAIADHLPADWREQGSFDSGAGLSRGPLS